MADAGTTAACAVLAAPDDDRRDARVHFTAGVAGLKAGAGNALVAQELKQHVRTELRHKARLELVQQLAGQLSTIEDGGRAVVAIVKRDEIICDNNSTSSARRKETERVDALAYSLLRCPDA